MRTIQPDRQAKHKICSCWFQFKATFF